MLSINANAAPAPATDAANNIKPPIAAKVAWQETRHGEVVKDDYYWLRHKEKPEVKAYLEAENAYTESMSAHLRPVSEQIFQEIKGRMKETDLSVPVKKGRYYYYSRFEAGKQYPIYCRRLADEKGNDNDKAAEEILLDVNQLAQGHKFTSVARQNVSPDGRYLAYTTDHTGYRQYQLHVKDLQTGKLLPDSAERVTSLAWASDNKTLFFVQEDATTKRSAQLFRLSLGGKAVLVQEEKDEQFGLDVGTSHDKQFIMLSSEATDTSETWMLPADQPEGKFRPVLGRTKGHRYDVEHRAGQLLIRTNRDAKNFKLISTPLATPEPKHWQEVVAHDDKVLLSNLDVFQDFLVVTEKSQALNRIRIYNFASKSWQTLKFDDQIYAAHNMFATEFDSGKMRVSYQSPITPSSVLEVDMANGARRLLKQQEVLGGYDSSRYETRRLWATAPDGVKVPMFAVYKKGLKLDGNAPALLGGYGAYGIPSDPFFSQTRISLLDRGAVYVQAQIRGGNDMGEAWHEDGMLMKKKNTFTDFIACAEYLLAEKWTNKQRLIIAGGSAGGLLMGAVVNMRPDLFKAVHAAVPFVDVMNTMLDKSLPLTAGEYLEWGDPNDKAAYDYMRSYSPYDNIAKKAYPSILVTTGLNDSQVMYWEPAKYVAKLRAHKTDNNLVLLKTNMAAGHGGASGRYDAIRETAFHYAWMLEQWGLLE